VADIYIDMGALDRTRDNLSNVEDLLRGPCRTMASLPCEAAGQPVLRDRLSEFGDEWDYGIGKLGDFSGAAVDALATIKDAFLELDAQLADSFQGGR
jgi:hypothetical protein